MCVGYLVDSFVVMRCSLKAGGPCPVIVCVKVDSKLSRCVVVRQLTAQDVSSKQGGSYLVIGCLISTHNGSGLHVS